MGIIFKIILMIHWAYAFENLEIIEVRDSNPFYEDFCQREPSECLAEGNQELIFNDDLLSVLLDVNRMVNKSVSFMLDSDQYGREEYWSLPTSVGGDCEDNALIKRQILVEEFGLPRSSIRMVTAFHKSMFYAHALLAVVTDQGVFILDQDENKVVKSREANYIFEAVELPGRRWARFLQEW